MFEKLEWSDDRLVLNGVTFLLETKARRGSTGGIWLHKNRPLLDDYERLFADYPHLQVKNMVELGIWKGGSLAFWMEALHPDKLVALDLMQRQDAPEFSRYLEEKGLRERLKTYWATDQSDAARLREIVSTEFDGPLDLVIDDASHAFAPTRSSFETLFPFVREGGLYIIEDWPWHFAPEYRPDFPSSEPGLLPLLTHMAVLTVAAPDVVRRLDVRFSFIVLQRGPLPQAEAGRRLTELSQADPDREQPDPLRPLRRLKRRLMSALRGI